MKINNRFPALHRFPPRIMFLAVFLFAFGTSGLSAAHAQMPARNDRSRNESEMAASEWVGGYIVSNGQFVYGPNIGDFDLKEYIKTSAPHLSKYADDLYGRSEYFSINPKIYLTLLETHSYIISNPDAALAEDSFGLKSGGFIFQIDDLSTAMQNAYYLHLYSYSALSVSQRTLQPFIAPGDLTINVTPDTNAGTYAIIAGLAAIDEKDISLILDNNQPNGFYQTYVRLFGNDNPLDETNHIHIPGEAGALAAPDNLLQLPFLNGLSWKFGGVHDTTGGGGPGSSYNDASSLDFYPWPSAWGMDTSNMWVVAAGAGIPTRYSDCGYKISHSGVVNVGWETTYYHLEGAKDLVGFVNRNDKIGVIANTEEEATCTGGSASGPHVHFSLKYNGAYTAINGTPLSGWYVHTGRNNYDVDHNYMWLERTGIKKYPFSDSVLSESAPTIFSDVFISYWASNYIETLYNAGITGGCTSIPLNYCPDNTVTRAQMAIFLLKGIHGSSYVPPAIEASTGFGDVTGDYWAAAWIKQLAAEGITSGCGDGNYCPDATVTRAQMAVFLLKAKHGSLYSPSDVIGVFTDVPAGYWADKWVEQLAIEGVTSGCGPDIYCPDSSVTRAQMAVFLVKTFNLP